MRHGDIVANLRDLRSSLRSQSETPPPSSRGASKPWQGYFRYLSGYRSLYHAKNFRSQSSVREKSRSTHRQLHATCEGIPLGHMIPQRSTERRFAVGGAGQPATDLKTVINDVGNYQYPTKPRVRGTISRCLGPERPRHSYLQTDAWFNPGNGNRGSKWRWLERLP